MLPPAKDNVNQPFKKSISVSKCIKKAGASNLLLPRAKALRLLYLTCAPNHRFGQVMNQKKASRMAGFLSVLLLTG
jgi:hypothetical protein